MDWLDLLAVQGTLKSLLQHQRVGLLFQAEGKATLGFGGGAQKTMRMLTCSLSLFSKLESDGERQMKTARADTGQST